MCACAQCLRRLQHGPVTRARAASELTYHSSDPSAPSMLTRCHFLFVAPVNTLTTVCNPGTKLSRTNSMTYNLDRTHTEHYIDEDSRSDISSCASCDTLNSELDTANDPIELLSIKHIDNNDHGNTQTYHITQIEPGQHDKSITNSATNPMTITQRLIKMERCSFSCPSTPEGARRSYPPGPESRRMSAGSQQGSRATRWREARLKRNSSSLDERMTRSSLEASKC